MANYTQQAKALVAQMTLEEAAGQLRYDAPAIPRLGIPAYNWWNEALHGVARAGTATVFPQAIALGAMFDEQGLGEIADTISTEARAKYNMQSSRGDRDIYKGLTLWSPNINIFRDPRWGRGQETYGEDPYLTTRLGVAFIKGLQGEGEHLKTAACAKHFAVHSGPEALRHSFDAVATERDMYETYLPAFEAAVKEAKVESVMGAYNRTNGEPCCGSEALLEDILRGEWGFTGHVVSDCWAILDFHKHHFVTETLEESAALALNTGCDLNCGSAYRALLDAQKQGLVREDTIRRSAERLMEARYKLGILGGGSEYDTIPYTVNDCPAHAAKALAAAEKSAVLLKNNGVLPLDPASLATVAVIGPNANSVPALLGNYFGTPSEPVTNLQGIREALPEDTRLLYAEGCHLFKDSVDGGPDDRLAEATACAEAADVVFLCLGLDAGIEGEQGDAGNSYAAGDRPDLYLPAPQRRLLKTVLDTGTPVVLVLNLGSAVDLGGEDTRCAAILHCWYSGGLGGRALANLLFGKASPSGRLPISFVREGTLPDFTSYSMQGRTYRYADEGTVLYPFGFGLGYTRFAYRNLQVDSSGGSVHLTVEVTNTGGMDADEVIQVYCKPNHAGHKADSRNAAYSHLLEPDTQPRHSLCAFRRVHIPAGQTATICFTIPARQLATVLENGERVLLKGRYTLYAGGCQPDALSERLTGTTPLRQEIELA